jgi:predicted pyridoxine 5'-phosphate oxidase superfamily flavin-nucleotide-binding protein
MVDLPENVKELLKGGHEIWVATVGEDGWPNVAIKGSGALLDDGNLYFADIFSKKTRDNLLYSSKVAIGLFDREKGVAVQIKGVADMIETGESYEQVKAKVAEAMPAIPSVRYLVRVMADSVWDMSAGPRAGEKIA